MHIINIGTPLLTTPAFKVIETDFFSNITFLDADLIFWNIQSSYKSFPGSLTKNNRIEKTHFDVLKKKIQNRKEEFNEFFNIGRTLVITSPLFERYHYSTSNPESIGYLDLIDCLDINKPLYERISGENIESDKEGIAIDFLLKNKHLIHYSIKIIKPKGNPLLYIKDTKYVISEYYKVNNGFIIVLPNLRPDLGHKQNISQHFINTINDLITGIKNTNYTEKHQIPEWANNYFLSGEKAEKDNLSKLITEQEEIEYLIKESNSKLSNYLFLKSLFSSDGNTLENAVEYVFKEIGFNVEKPTTNRDDLIIRTDSKVAVVEIKGLTKSAAEKNAAQLQKWVSNYHADNEFNPKGILIVNTFKSKMLEKRTGVDFPKQMLPFSKQMNHCLITGLQLLYIYLDFKAQKLTLDEIVTLLFETIGVLEYKKEPSNLISVHDKD